MLYQKTHKNCLCANVDFVCQSLSWCVIKHWDITSILCVTFVFDLHLLQQNLAIPSSTNCLCLVTNIRCRFDLTIRWPLWMTLRSDLDLAYFCFLSLSLSVCPSIYLTVPQIVCLSVSLRLSSCLPICLICRSVIFWLCVLNIHCKYPICYHLIDVYLYKFFTCLDISNICLNHAVHNT